eukprot:3989744-Pyramimonas_sp.AAC.1
MLRLRICTVGVGKAFDWSRSHSLKFKHGVSGIMTHRKRKPGGGFAASCRLCSDGAVQLEALVASGGRFELASFLKLMSLRFQS